MNQLLKGIFVFSLLTSFVIYGADNCCANTSSCNSCNDCNNCCLGPCDGYPFLQIRSQGRNSARELVEQKFINKYDMDSTYGTFSVDVEYSKSFRNERLTRFLFGNDLVNGRELYIQGSQVENRHAKAWLADNFGLPTDFQSKISFCPSIQNVIFDLDFYLGLDELAEGLFIKIHAPIVWTKWSLCPTENICVDGENNFDPGYMSQNAIPRSSLANSFLQTMNGNYTYGDMLEPIKYGKIGNNCNTKTRLAEIDFSFGWNFILEQDYHFGAFLYVSVPTGNHPLATHLFEPIVGNGKHWEFGGGLTISWIFYRSEECQDRYFGLWIEATISHLFKNCQCRSFDFCSKPNSRYMLLEEMGSNDDIIQGEVDSVSTTASLQYKKNLIPAVNWSTFQVDVKIDVQADIALKLGYVRENWNFDIGYNLWARTGEKFCSDCNTSDTSGKQYAIKGDTWLYGAETDGTAAKFPLSASQSLANIHTGRNYPAIDSDNPKTNPRIDNPYLAEKDDSNLFIINPTATTVRINTSIDPIIVSRSQLNMSNSPSSITHKVFGHIGYVWKDLDQDWVPFLGIGGEVEFAQDNYKNCNSNSCDSCDTSCNSCCDNCTKHSGLSLWGIWVKSGIAFD